MTLKSFSYWCVSQFLSSRRLTGSANFDLRRAVCYGCGELQAFAVKLERHHRSPRTYLTTTRCPLSHPACPASLVSLGCPHEHGVLQRLLSSACALLAMPMPHWVCRYPQASRPWYAPHRRTRIRIFRAEGMEQSGLPHAVEALPVLLHAAVFLFFAALVDILTIPSRFPTPVVAVAASAYLCMALLAYPN